MAFEIGLGLVNFFNVIFRHQVLDLAQVRPLVRSSGLLKNMTREPN